MICIVGYTVCETKLNGCILMINVRQFCKQNWVMAACSVFFNESLDFLYCNNLR